MVCRALCCGEGGKVDFCAHQGKEPCAKETFKVVLSLTVVGATVLIALGYKLVYPKYKSSLIPGICYGSFLCESKFKQNKDWISSLILFERESTSVWTCGLKLSERSQPMVGATHSSGAQSTAFLASWTQSQCHFYKYETKWILGVFSPFTHLSIY